MVNAALIATWKLLEDTALQEGTLAMGEGSVRSVEWLARKIGIDPQAPGWSDSLLNILSKTSQSEDASTRVAATGIARSFFKMSNGTL